MFPLSCLNKRSTEKEYLDMPDVAENDILESFRFIRFANRWGGGHKVIRTALATVLGSWPRQRRVEILDVGCGMGDMATSVFEWGEDNGFSIRYTGIDSNSRIITLARARTNREEIKYSVGDLFDGNLPEADIIIASMVFHHLEEGEIEKALGHLLVKTKYALIINDLTRSFALCALCYVLTRFVKNKATRDDALLSVKKGFRVEEMRALLEKVNIKGVIKKQFCGRFSVIILKE